jgi:hypothetical protein
MQEGAPSADPSSLALCRAVDFCRVGIAHRCEPPRSKTVGNAHPTMAHSAPRRVYQRLATSEADSFSLDNRGRTQASFDTCGWRPFAFQCGLGGFPAIGPLTNVESKRILDSVLFHPAIAVGHINCLSEPFLAAALNQRPSRIAVILHAAAGDTSPKRKRGRQTIALFTLRVSMGCLISDRAKYKIAAWDSRKGVVSAWRQVSMQASGYTEMSTLCTAMPLF